MKENCDLKVYIDGQEIFFLNKKIISSFSGRLRRLLTAQENERNQIPESTIQVNGCPGGPHGFELITRFCYNNGVIRITPSNICVLYCSAIFLEMTEDVSNNQSLLHQTQTFLDGLFYWTWEDTLVSLESCESFLSSAESYGLLDKIISSLVAKMNANNSDVSFTASSPSSASSPETTSGSRPSSSVKTPESIKPSCRAYWWFDDLTIFSPKIIEKIIMVMGDLWDENTSFILTKFVLHYLKIAPMRLGKAESRSDYGGLVETAVNGVVLMGRDAFSCRGLFWVLRVVSKLGLNKVCRNNLERLIGGVLDKAKLDDLLISGHDGGVYNVNLVIRLARAFVSEEDGMSLDKMKKVGLLIDKYMREISPDNNLKMSKFLAVAESLPDVARDCYDGVYRAIDIYLESHPTLSQEERTRLCRCLNYEKLTLEACKDLAKSPKIPPKIAMQALMAQQSRLQNTSPVSYSPKTPKNKNIKYVLEGASDVSKEEIKMNIQKMQCRVVELEKICREMKGQMSKIVKNRVIQGSLYSRPLPKLC